MSDRSEAVAAVLNAQRLARRGLLDEAQSIIQSIRGTYRIEADALLAAQLMIAEGCIAAYRGDWNEARDRLSRARLIAVGQRLLDVELMATAWLSFVDFNDGKLDQALQSSISVIKNWRQAEPYALFRSASVLSFLCYLSGSISWAEQWQALSKRMAELTEDSSATSALIFDAAAIRLVAMRFDAEIEGKKELDFGREVAFCRSAKNFDTMADVRVMSALHLLLEGQAMNLAGQHLGARELLATFGDEIAGLPAVSKAQGAIELVWAKSRSDPKSLSSSEVQSACAAFERLFEDDDIAVYGSRMARVCGSLGLRAESERFLAASLEAASRFVEWRKSFRVRLDEAFDQVGLNEQDSISRLMIDASSGLKLNR